MCTSMLGTYWITLNHIFLINLKSQHINVCGLNESNWSAWLCYNCYIHESSKDHQMIKYNKLSLSTRSIFRTTRHNKARSVTVHQHRLRNQFDPFHFILLSYKLDVVAFVNKFRSVELFVRNWTSNRNIINF